MRTIAINGAAGEIGRNLLRQNAQRPNVDQVDIKDLFEGFHSRDAMVELLNNDPIRGGAGTIFRADGQAGIHLDGHGVMNVHTSGPNDMPDLSSNWGVFESTGARVQEDKAMELITQGGVQKVLVTAPTKGPGNAATLIPGYNEHEYDPRKDHLVTNESCTTKSAIHVLKALYDRYGVEALSLTTVHAETGQEKRDLIQRGIVPADLHVTGAKPRSTGSQGALSKLFPSVKVSAEAYRVPTADGSITDMTFKLLRRCDSEEELIQVLEDAVRDGIWEIVDSIDSSADIIGNPHDAVVARDKIRRIDVNTVRIAAGYDNAYAPTRSALDAMKYMIDRS